jgi:membrane fusion protein
VSLPAAPIAWRVLFGFVALATAFAGTFVASAGFARKESASGSLISTAGLIRVAPRRDGVLSDLRVGEGERVAAGQALFTVGSSTDLESGGTLDAAVLANIDAQMRLLQEQIEAEPARTAGESRRLDALIRTVEAQNAALLAQRAWQAQRVRVAQDRYDALRDLHGKGSVSKAALQAQEENLLEMRQALAELERQLAATDREREQTRHQRDQLPVEQGERLSQLRLSLAERERQRAEIDARRAQVIRAPIAGRVTALQAGPGQTVDASRPLLTLVPVDAELRAELFVPSRAIGFVKPGQRVRLQIEAFPYQRFGTQGGTVETVSQAVLAPQDVIGKVTLAEPAYRVTVRLDRQTVDAFGTQTPLQPDMALTADIVLEERSLLAWLVEPLLSVRGRM